MNDKQRRPAGSMFVQVDDVAVLIGQPQVGEPSAELRSQRVQVNHRDGWLDLAHEVVPTTVSRPATFHSALMVVPASRNRFITGHRVSTLRAS